MSFDLGMGVLDGVDVLQGEGGGESEGFGSFLPHWFEWHIVKQKCIRLVCGKLTIFPYGQWKRLFIGFLII